MTTTQIQIEFQPFSNFLLNLTEKEVYAAACNFFLIKNWEILQLLIGYY